MSNFLNRRRFLLAGGMAAAGRMSADTSCGPVTCRSEIDFDEFAQEAFQTQYRTEWCWAASISMIFSFYGHPVSQARIVTDVYGAPVNMPSGYGALMAALLNRTWKDDNGDRFRSRLTGAYDPAAGVRAVNNNMLVRELDQGHPVLIGTAGHAVVLAMMEYAKAFAGVGQVVRCGVFDPWPGRGARDLVPAEMLPVELGGALEFIATARVEDLD